MRVRDGNVDAEAAMLLRLGRHPNLVRFLGLCKDGPDVLMVNEFAERALLMLTFSVRIEPRGPLHRGSADIDAVADALVGDLTRLIAGRGVVPRVSRLGPRGILYVRKRAHLIRFCFNLVEAFSYIDLLCYFLGRYEGRHDRLL
jgi:hypothetical protein